MMSFATVALLLPIEPVTLNSNTRHGGRAAAGIAGDSRQINNINKQYLKLKPHTTYTLTAWIKTENLVGSPGAQFYPYEFDGADPAGPSISVTGTTDWTRYRQVFTTAEDGASR